MYERQIICLVKNELIRNDKIVFLALTLLQMPPAIASVVTHAVQDSEPAKEDNSVVNKRANIKPLRHFNKSVRQSTSSIFKEVLDDINQQDKRTSIDISSDSENSNCTVTELSDNHDSPSTANRNNNKRPSACLRPRSIMPEVIKDSNSSQANSDDSDACQHQKQLRSL